jgi:hypothetical protein
MASVDYEYERYGRASIFMFAEPLSGFRQTTGRPQRTKVDWAIEVAHLLDNQNTQQGERSTRHLPRKWLLDRLREPFRKRRTLASGTT